MTVFARGPLTDWLLDRLESELSEINSAVLLGDGIAPEDGGWTGGQPGVGQFRAYTVITTAAATRLHASPIGDSANSWSAGYVFRSVGGSRQQAEWAADRTRVALDRVKKINLDLMTGTWRLTKVHYETLGGVSRNDSTDPPYWELADTAGLWLDREQT